MTDTPSDTPEVARLRERLERERRARRESEDIAERTTRDLYQAVAELERVNRELSDSNAGLERTNESLREFVAIAAHDIRSPLTSMLGFTQLLRTRWPTVDDRRREEFFAVIEEQGHRLQRLVEDLLTMSSIEAGALQVDGEPIDVRAEIERIVLEAADPDLEGVKVDVDAGVRALCDRDHFERMVSNYLVNAVRYGEPPITVVVSRDAEWVEVRVGDEGEGVAEELADRLFDKFARAGTTKRGTAKGTGLGLSIVRGLARANGGDAWYEPNEPHGACFGIRLPVAH